MPRTARNTPGGWVYHVLNRSNGRTKLFKKEADFLAFELALKLAFDRVPIRILGWCVMPDHWRLILWPKKDGELTAFMRQLTLTHAQRWKRAHDAVGQGPLYRGRFKSLPVQPDEHLLAMLKSVEANPLNAKLVKRAEDWRWSSLQVRRSRKHELFPLLANTPVPIPPTWARLVNRPETGEQLKTIEEHLKRSRPFGMPAWVQKTAARLGSQNTLRSPGRQLGWRKSKKVGKKSSRKRK